MRKRAVNVALFRFAHSPLRLFRTALSVQEMILFYFAMGGGIHLPQKKWMQSLIPYVIQWRICTFLFRCCWHRAFCESTIC